MHIRRLLYSDIGRYVMSMLLGLGLATLFRKVCKDRNCLVFNAAPIGKIKKQIFKFDNKCYVFDHKAEKCNPVKKTLSFA